MRDKVYLGSSPSDEECIQITDDDYQIKAREQCHEYIKLIIKKFGQPPNNTKLRVIREQHDFGLYYEVVCEFDVDDETAINYAFDVENNAPTYWENSCSQQSINV